MLKVSMDAPLPTGRRFSWTSTAPFLILPRRRGQWLFPLWARRVHRRYRTGARRRARSYQRSHVGGSRSAIFAAAPAGMWCSRRRNSLRSADARHRPRGRRRPCLPGSGGPWTSRSRFSRRLYGRQALQFRSALQSRAELGADLRKVLGRLVAAEAIPEVEIIDACLAFEIKGRGFDKGSAIHRFLSRPPFIGEDPDLCRRRWDRRGGFRGARPATRRGISVGQASG